MVLFLGDKELAENVRNIRGGQKSVKKQLINACNSALTQETASILKMHQ